MQPPRSLRTAAGADEFAKEALPDRPSSRAQFTTSRETFGERFGNLDLAVSKTRILARGVLAETEGLRKAVQTSEK